MMSLFTNDLETVQDCFGSGILMFVDAAVLGGMSIVKMFMMNKLLTLLSLIPMVLMLAGGLILGKYLAGRFEIKKVANVKLGTLTRDLFYAVQDLGFAVGEIVNDDYFAVGFDKFNNGMRADKSGTACYKNSHFLSPL